MCAPFAPCERLTDHQGIATVRVDIGQHNILRVVLKNKEGGVIPEGRVRNRLDGAAKNGKVVVGHCKETFGVGPPGRVPAVWSFPRRNMMKLGIVSLPCALSRLPIHASGA